MRSSGTSTSTPNLLTRDYRPNFSFLLRSRRYEGFMRKKDMLRIRMPDEPERVVGGRWKPPRFDFSNNNMKTVRPRKSAIPTNTVELMHGQGLKYVHALGKGKQGLDADLESCQKKLNDTGYV